MAKYFDDLKLSFGYHTAGNFPFTHCVKELDGRDGVHPHNNLDVVTSRTQYDLDAWNGFPDLKVGARILGLVKTDTNEIAPFSGNAYTCACKYRDNNGNDHCFCIPHKADEYVKIVEAPRLGYINYTGGNLIDLGQLCNISRVGVVSLIAVANDVVIDVKSKNGARAIGCIDATQNIQFANAALDNAPGVFREQHLNYITDKLFLQRHGGDVMGDVGKAIIYIVYKPQDTVEVVLNVLHSNVAGGYVVSSEFIDANAISATYTRSGTVDGDATIAVFRHGTANAVVNPTALTGPLAVQDGRKAFTGEALALAQPGADTQDTTLRVVLKMRFAKS